MNCARKRGGVSVVWHPIVFGNARDPGYGDLFWRLVEHVNSTDGLRDGRAYDQRLLATACRRIPELRGLWLRFS